MDPGRARASGHRGRRPRDRGHHGQLRRPGRRAPRAAATPGVGRRAGRDVRRAAAHGGRRERGPCERAQGAEPARAGARARRAGPDRRPGATSRQPAAAASRTTIVCIRRATREHWRARSRPAIALRARGRELGARGRGVRPLGGGGAGRTRHLRGGPRARRFVGHRLPQVAQRPLRLRRRSGARPARPRAAMSASAATYLAQGAERHPFGTRPRCRAGPAGSGVGRAPVARARGTRRADRAHLPARDTRS